MTPFTTEVGGVFSGKWDAPEGNNTTLSAQLDNILTGRSYINFHTTQFPGGEIRGAIVPELIDTSHVGCRGGGSAGLQTAACVGYRTEKLGSRGLWFLRIGSANPAPG